MNRTAKRIALCTLIAVLAVAATARAAVAQDNIWKELLPRVEELRQLGKSQEAGELISRFFVRHGPVLLFFDVGHGSTFDAFFSEQQSFDTLSGEAAIQQAERMVEFARSKFGEQHITFATAQLCLALAFERADRSDEAKSALACC